MEKKMIRELVKFILLLIFIVAVMLIIGCGTRRIDQSKDIQRVNTESISAKKQELKLNGSVSFVQAHESSSENSEDYDHETIIETFSIGPDGKPYLSGREINRNKGNKKNKGSEKTNSTGETKIDQTEFSEKTDKSNSNAVDKTNVKITEADNSIKANIGWLPIVALLFMIFGGLYLYLRNAKNKRNIF